MPDESDIERDYQCLEDCLALLTKEVRQMVLDYYSEDKLALINKRKAMAARLGITTAALRLRMHRIRDDLRKCVEACLSRSPLF